MRELEYSTAFKKDYKREAKGQYRKVLDRQLEYILTTLVNDRILEIKYKYHDLCGDWKRYRECHIKPDLLLIYSKPSKILLRLVRLGLHSNLFS